jgi:tyrosine-protein kinase Etk/Wzc
MNRETIDPESNGPEIGAASSFGQQRSALEYLPILLRGKWIITGTFLVIFGGVAVYTFLSKPVYEASSLVLIGEKEGKGSMPFSVDLSGTTKATILNELEILKSRSLAHSVVNMLLNIKVLDSPERARIPIIQSIDKSGRDTTATAAEIVDRLDKQVDFVPVKESDVIRITARSNNPSEAALLANTYAESYVERNMNISRTRSRSVREFLQSQLESKKLALDTTETALQSYMRNSGTISLDDETKRIVDQLSQLEATRDGLELDISSRQKTLSSYREELARQEPAVAKSIGESNDSYIRLLQEQLARLQVQRDVVIAQNPDLLGEKIYSDKLKETDEQILSLQQKLQNRTGQYLASIVPSVPGEGSGAYLAQTKQKIIEQQIELEGLSARSRALSGVIKEYEKQFLQIPQKSVDLARLQRSRLSSEKLYLMVEEKYSQAAIKEKSEFGYVDVIDPALVPSTPVGPKRLLNLVLGGLLGIGVGIGLVFLRSLLDVRVRTPEDLKKHGLTMLAPVSRIIGTEDPLRGASMKGAKTKLDFHLVTFYSPMSPTAESYRRLRTNVQYAQLSVSLKSILVTSPNPGEGKSTTAANLAIAFAQTEKSILLVDADMRLPMIHTLFGINKRPGLAEYLFSRTTLEEITWTNVVPHLDVICCGTRLPNPAEVPGSAGMVEFMKQVAERYDIVLFDSPPILAATDATVLSATVDGTILVALSGATDIPSIERSIEALEAVGGKFLGIVLNNFEPTKAYGGYYSKSYRGYTYGHSPYTPDPDGRKDKSSKAGR